MQGERLNDGHDADDEAGLVVSAAEAAPFFHPDGSWNGCPFGTTPEEVEANLAKHFPGLAQGKKDTP